MMFDSWDGKIWYPRFYDMDTICSYDNSGQIKFDVDIEMEQGYWNTSTSRLWTKIRDWMHNDLVATYKDLRQNGLSYETLMKYFYDEQIAKIPQTYYNNDCDVKYIPYANEYIGKAHGDGYEHLKRWLKRRIIFCDTLFDYSPSYTNDVLTIRANTTETMTLEIETYTPVYQHLSWYNNQMDKKKINGKTSVTFTGNAQASTDQEVLIYGGSNIKSIKGISTMNPNQMLIGSATRLIELDARNCPLLTDINSNKANLSPHTYLNKVDLSGCSQLGGALRLNNSPLIRDINMKGTVITSVQMPTSVRNLEVLRLPNTIPSLTLQDASLLNTLEFDEGIALQSISLTNCNNLTNTINFDLTKTPTVYLDNSYNAEELYMSATTNLTLRNMSSLRRVIYTPNNEYETFNLETLTSAGNYVISTFNNPNMTEFITTAPHRLSYNNGDYGNIKPNTVFCANSLDLSNTQFTEIKFLCTTDLYNLKVPTTMKNFYCDSAMDIDTEVIEDADYSVIHDELIEPYTTNYESEVYRYEEKYLEGYSIPQSNWQEGYQLNNGELQSQAVARVSDFFPVSPNTTFSATSTGEAITQVPYTGVSFYDENKKHIQYFGLQTPRTVPSNGRYARISLSTRIAINEFTINYTGIISRTPNIIPSSANGSLIFSMYSNRTTEPSVNIWDLYGLELENFYTYGMNNDVKPNDDSIVLLNKNEELTYCYGSYSNGSTTKGEIWANSNTLSLKCLGWLKIPKGNHIMRTSNGTNVTPCWWDDTNGMMRTPGYAFTNGQSYNWNDTRVTTDYYECYLTINNQVEWIMIDNIKFDLTTISDKGITGATSDTIVMSNLGDLVVYNEGCDNILNGTPTSITMPKRYAPYSIQIKNANITPNNYPTMLYPKLIDTTLPITGKLDYSTYQGSSLAWAFAYTTDAVERIPLDSRNMGGITNQYNKLYGTDYADVIDVWIYKNIDANTLETNENITKAYIELTNDNWQTRIDEILQYYPNCTDLYLFDDGSITTLNNLFDLYITNKNQILNVTFMEGYFENLINLSRTFKGASNLQKVNNIPKTTIYLTNTFENCSSFNQQLDLSEFNISKDSLSGAFINCSSLTNPPILPSNYEGFLDYCFNGCSKLVESPIIPNGVTSLYYCFNGCSLLPSISSIPSNCDNYAGAFQRCSSLTSVPTDGWNGNMSNTFNSCTSLNQQINISSATNLESTFQNCRALSVTPNLPATANCTMSNCFYGCTNLVTPPTTPEGVTNMEGCFRGCKSLTQTPNIPNTCTRIASIYYDCENLNDVVIPLHVTGYASALDNCGFTNITWEGERRNNFTLTIGGLSNKPYTQEDIQELVPEHLDDLYKDSIKLNCNDTKVIINGKESVYVESARYVEYIQGDGTNYIDIDIYANPQWKYEFTRSGTDAQYGIVFDAGDYIRFKTKTVYFSVFEYGNDLYFEFEYDLKVNTSIYTVTIDKNSCYVNGELKGTITEAETSDTTQFTKGVRLFKTFQSRTDIYGVSKGKLYSFKMWDENGTLQFDGRPCLVNEEYPCLYDEVSKKFFFPQS